MDNRKTAKIISLVVTLAGILVIIGWIADIGFLKSIVPGFVTMKFVTALSFFFSGLILFFMLELQRGNDLARVMLPISSMAVLLLMGVILVSSFLGLRTGIEELFVKEGLGAVKTTVPGRPSIGTMAEFLLIAVSGISAMMNHRLSKILLWMGWAIVLIGAVAILGYVLRIPAFYYSFEGISTAMALHTAILFVLWGMGSILYSKGNTKTKETAS